MKYRKPFIDPTGSPEYEMQKIIEMAKANPYAATGLLNELVNHLIHFCYHNKGWSKTDIAKYLEARDPENIIGWRKHL